MQVQPVPTAAASISDNKSRNLTLLKHKQTKKVPDLCKSLEETLSK